MDAFRGRKAERQASLDFYDHFSRVYDHTWCSIITFHTSMITQPNSTVIQTILSLFFFYKVLAVSLLPRFLKAVQSKRPFNGVTVVYSNKFSDLTVRHRLAK